MLDTPIRAGLPEKVSDPKSTTARGATTGLPAARLQPQGETYPATTSAQADLDNKTRSADQAPVDPSRDPAVEAQLRAVAERAVETVEATVGECGGGADGGVSNKKGNYLSLRYLST